MYSASFSKASLTEAKRSLGPGKSALKTALRKADKAFLEARRAVAELAPRHGTLPAEAASAEVKQTSLLDAPEAETAFALPEPLFAEDGTVFFRELPAGLLKPLAGPDSSPAGLAGAAPGRRGPHSLARPLF